MTSSRSTMYFELQVSFATHNRKCSFAFRRSQGRRGLVGCANGFTIDSNDHITGAQAGPFRGETSEYQINRCSLALVVENDTVFDRFIWPLTQGMAPKRWTRVKKLLLS